MKHENLKKCKENEKEINQLENNTAKTECEMEKTSVEDMDYYTSLENKVKEYINIAQTIQADFDNYRKRSAEQIASSKFDGIVDAVGKIIPALDSFASAKKLITDENLLNGFNMIENQLNSALESLGVTKIETSGKVFDPNYHNALATVNEPSLDDNAIFSEYQAGYKIKDKIIRYSQVIVNKKEEK